MKTIEEYAHEYAHSDEAFLLEYEPANIWGLELAYMAGASQMCDELTRWRDPKEELPPVGKIVLVKIIFGSGYPLAKRGDEGWWYADSEEWAMSDKQVIGWLPILENE